jgi:histidine triad (HIT) family protein
MSCIFCRIVAGEIPGEIVAADDHSVAFLDVQPLADGHVLVVPRTHVATVEAMSSADAAAVFAMVHRLAGPVRRAVGAAGNIIGINDGAATGQTVPHVHVHIVPRREGDGGGSIHNIFQDGDRRPIAEVGAAIRKATQA